MRGTSLRNRTVASCLVRAAANHWPRRRAWQQRLTHAAADHVPLPSPGLKVHDLRWSVRGESNPFAHRLEDGPRHRAQRKHHVEESGGIEPHPANQAACLANSYAPSACRNPCLVPKVRNRTYYPSLTRRVHRQQCFIGKRSGTSSLNRTEVGR